MSSYTRGHEHEWRPIPERDPEFEDRSAYFFLQCQYQEVRPTTFSERHDEVFEETDPRCEEERHYSFEWSQVEVRYPDGETESVQRSQLECRPEGSVSHLQETVEVVLQRIEDADEADLDIRRCDPDPEHGSVVASTRGEDPTMVAHYSA